MKPRSRQLPGVPSRLTRWALLRARAPEFRARCFDCEIICRMAATLSSPAAATDLHRHGFRFGEFPCRARTKARFLPLALVGARLATASRKQAFRTGQVARQRVGKSQVWTAPKARRAKASAPSRSNCAHIVITELVGDRARVETTDHRDHRANPHVRAQPAPAGTARSRQRLAIGAEHLAVVGIFDRQLFQHRRRLHAEFPYAQAARIANATALSSGNVPRSEPQLFRIFLNILREEEAGCDGVPIDPVISSMPTLCSRKGQALPTTTRRAKPASGRR